MDIVNTSTPATGSQTLIDFLFMCIHQVDVSIYVFSSIACFLQLSNLARGQVDIVTYDYTGYGLSAGDDPGERACLNPKP